jgi:hypothetical protein
MTIKVGEKEYKVKFGYNSFCDSDLLDRTSDAMGIIGELQNASDKDSMAKVRKLFTLTRDLLFEGFKKKNPVESVDEVGDILDDYLEEDKENHGLLDVFTMLAQELLTEGFFGDLLNKSNKAMENLKKRTASKKK